DFAGGGAVPAFGAVGAVGNDIGRLARDRSWRTGRPCAASWRTKAVLIPAETVVAVSGAGCLRKWVVDRNAYRAEIGALLGRCRKGDRRRSSAAIAEAVVIGIVENLLLPPAKRNQRAAEVDAVLVAVFDRLDWNTGSRIGGLAPEAPGIQRRIAEEFVDRTVLLGAALLDGVVHDALAFIDGRVASGLHLELVDGVNRNRGPHIARVAVAAGAHKHNAVYINSRSCAAASGAVDHADVGCRVAIGFIALHTGHEVNKVGGAPLIGGAIGAHLDRQLRVHLVFHGGAERCIGGFQLRGRVCHRNLDAGAANRQNGVVCLRLERVHMDVLLNLLFKAPG